MRNPSLFKSTKSFVGKGVELSNSLMDLGIMEIRDTQALNKEENATELLEARVVRAKLTTELTVEGYAQLQEIEATNLPDSVKELLKANLLKALGL